MRAQGLLERIKESVGLAFALLSPFLGPANGAAECSSAFNFSRQSFLTSEQTQALDSQMRLIQELKGSVVSTLDQLALSSIGERQMNADRLSMQDSVEWLALKSFVGWTAANGNKALNSHQLDFLKELSALIRNEKVLENATQTRSIVVKSEVPYNSESPVVRQLRLLSHPALSSLFSSIRTDQHRKLVTWVVTGILTGLAFQDAPAFDSDPLPIWISGGVPKLTEPQPVAQSARGSIPVVDRGRFDAMANRYLRFFQEYAELNAFQFEVLQDFVDYFGVLEFGHTDEGVNAHRLVRLVHSAELLDLYREFKGDMLPGSNQSGRGLRERRWIPDPVLNLWSSLLSGQLSPREFRDGITRTYRSISSALPSASLAPLSEDLTPIRISPVTN